MKILLVHNTYLEPGGEDVVFELERQLLKSAGHEVFDYCRSNSEMQHYSTVRRLSMLGRTVWASDSHKQLRQVLRQRRPDVVHAHNTFPLISPSLYWACHSEQVPVVQSLHNYRLLCPGSNFFRDGRACEDCLGHGPWRGVVHGCYRNSRQATAAVALMLAAHRRRGTWTNQVDRYIALTDFARKKFVQGGLPADKIAVKPNFISPDPGPRASNGSYALFVGRLYREKGIYTLLSAWTRMKKPLPLHIVGDGPSAAELHTMASGKDSSQIRFLGRLPRREVLGEMKDASCLIFPSEVYENFPMAILEAFACGVPVIASDAGAMPEIVEDGRTGWIFRAGDAQDLEEKMAGAWSHPEEMRARGKAAREEWMTKYTAEKNYRMLMDIYEGVIAGRAVSEPVASLQEHQQAYPA